MITRRTFIKRTAQAGIAAVAAANLNPFSVGSSGAALLPLGAQELHIPAVISGGDLTLAPATTQIYPGINTNVLLINNSFPAPTIKVKKGDTFSATIKNNLTEDSLLHWHGVHSPSAMSGHPKDAVPAGGSYSVNFPIIQRACTNFYHAHPDMNTGKQVYMGIAGMFIIEDDEEKALALPSGDYDIPLMITDKRFDSNKQLIYSPNNLDINSGWLGDTILINGTPNAYLPVAPTLYRFRLVNASNSRFYKVALSDGKSFTVIGNDGGLLDKPVSLTDSWLAPAERLDILVDFSSYTQGQTVSLKSIKFSFSDGPGSGTVAQGAEMDLIQFQVTKSGSSGSNIPTQLPAIVKFQEADAKRTRIWTFAAIHHVNDMQFDINRIDAHVPFGELEKWTFVSEAQNTHPIHVHGVQFQVLDRNGAAPDPVEAGWKDVVRLDPVGTVNVLIKFNEYAGLFLIHCHKLEHADMGMMANFMVEQTGGVKEKNGIANSITIEPNPVSDHVTISFPSLDRNETLMIVNEKGNIFLEEKLFAGSAIYKLSTTHYASGNYEIRVGSNKAKMIVVR